MNKYEIIISENESVYVSADGYFTEKDGEIIIFFMAKNTNTPELPIYRRDIVAEFSRSKIIGFTLETK